MINSFNSVFCRFLGVSDDVFVWRDFCFRLTMFLIWLCKINVYIYFPLFKASKWLFKGLYIVLSKFVYEFRICVWAWFISNRIWDEHEGRQILSNEIMCSSLVRYIDKLSSNKLLTTARIWIEYQKFGLVFTLNTRNNCLSQIDMYWWSSRELPADQENKETLMA